jgi:hypothetical protein
MKTGLDKVRLALQTGQKYSRVMRLQSEILTQKISEPIMRTEKQAVSLRTILRNLWPSQR